MGRAQAAPLLERRALPADRAVALYGVVPAALAGRRLVVDGHRAMVLRLGRLGLITAAVDPSEFSSHGIEQRRTDRKWLRQQARHHERVLERMRADGNLWPAPFLTIYEGLDAFDAAAQGNYTRWSRALSRLSGKVEYGVHAFIGPHALPSADPYLLRVGRRARGRVTARIRSAATPLDAHARDLWEAMRNAAAAMRRFDGRGVRGFVLGATLLVDESGELMLRAALSALAPAGHALGVSVYLEGPLPPFSFA
ncbi:MAG: GvpL/GvpF family gas vesicle protein [Candidatus Eremiobacteraeota bacterium]|nr:GvpL/GvpF family gas vesicle protein [Candidatus Eremiobacteraeota bacterium]